MTESLRKKDGPRVRANPALITLETLMVYLAEELTSKPNKPVLSHAAQQELVTLQ